MRQALAFTASLFPAFAAQQCYAQELPVFDDGDFEIVSVEPNSRIIARSDGRDFYCYADERSAGYVLVFGCLPFVSRSETAEADARWAEAVAAADAAAARAREVADAAAASAKVVAVAMAEKAKAEAILAAKAAVDEAAKLAKERQARFDQMFDSLDQETAKNAILALAKFRSCALKVENRKIADPKLVQRLWLTAGGKLDGLVDQSVKEAALGWFSSAMDELEITGKIGFSSDGKLMRLKDCT